jgi:hypothetical protein
LRSQREARAVEWMFIEYSMNISVLVQYVFNGGSSRYSGRPRMLSLTMDDKVNEILDKTATEASALALGTARRSDLREATRPDSQSDRAHASGNLPGKSSPSNIYYFVPASRP